MKINYCTYKNDYMQLHKENAYIFLVCTVKRLDEQQMHLDKNLNHFL